MINRIRDLFARAETQTGKARSTHGHDELQIAACALLVEAATLDGDFDDDERSTIATVLQRHLKLNAEEAETLLAAASARQATSNQLLEFTRTIKNEYSPEERVEIIEMLWEVAYADGILHDYEANLLRRIGGLIYVSDRERGAARLRVLSRLGLEEQ
jgi:uncharacterized tellurite resistance protein B-like protein